MKIPVLIEPVAGHGFRATGALPFEASAEGSTRDEAIRHLRDVIASRVDRGVEIVSLDFTFPDAVDNPWTRFAGMYKDEPLFDEWQEAIQAYRRQVDVEDAAGP